ncbi:hypothetical protein BDV06DRAFT_225307 [Aspergillus oleicola]
MAVGNNTVVEESRFAKIKPAASGGAFAIAAEYQGDTDPRKVGLLIGACRDDKGQAWQLPCLKEAKHRMNVESQSHEYLPLQGNPEFLQAARQLVFGSKVSKDDMGAIASI